MSDFIVRLQQRLKSYRPLAERVHLFRLQPGARISVLFRWPRFHLVTLLDQILRQRRLLTARIDVRNDGTVRSLLMNHGTSNFDCPDCAWQRTCRVKASRIHLIAHDLSACSTVSNGVLLSVRCRTLFAVIPVLEGEQAPGIVCRHCRPSLWSIYLRASLRR